jgi:hypothetical protein
MTATHGCPASILSGQSLQNQPATPKSDLKNSLEVLNRVIACCERNGSVYLRARRGVLGARHVLYFGVAAATRRVGAAHNFRLTNQFGLTNAHSGVRILGACPF